MKAEYKYFMSQENLPQKVLKTLILDNKKCKATEPHSFTSAN